MLAGLPGAGSCSLKACKGGQWWKPVISPPCTKGPMQLAKSPCLGVLGSSANTFQETRVDAQCGRSQCDRAGEEFLLIA